MSDVAIAAAKRVAAEWTAEVEKRRRVSRHDPVADAIEYCAEELVERLKPLDAPGATRTVGEWAHEQGVTLQTVRNYINRGELEATRTPHGWRIPRGARRQRRKRHEAAA